MPEPTGYDRHTGPRDRSLRVGDREREAAADVLRREHVNGRLDVVELQERLDRALTAKTYAELDSLVADLPTGDPPRRRRPSRWTPRPWPIAIVPFVVIAVIVASGGRALWLAFPLFALFVLRPLAWRSWGRGYRGHGRW
ncbi:MAG TPA: DUF1707 domain-containing protein [Gaiellaceae bacterium]|jgi:hypothetical protein